MRHDEPGGYKVFDGGVELSGHGGALVVECGGNRLTIGGLGGLSRGPGNIFGGAKVCWWCSVVVM